MSTWSCRGRAHSATHVGGMTVHPKAKGGGGSRGAAWGHWNVARGPPRPRCLSPPNVNIPGPGNAGRMHRKGARSGAVLPPLTTRGLSQLSPVLPAWAPTTDAHSSPWGRGCPVPSGCHPDLCPFTPTTSPPPGDLIPNKQIRAQERPEPTLLGASGGQGLCLRFSG